MKSFIAVAAALALLLTAPLFARPGEAGLSPDASAQTRAPKMPQAPPSPPPAPPGAAFGDKPLPGAGKIEVVWKRRKFRRGDRVRVTSWAGTIKPDESGHPAELNVGAGRTGTVLRGERRQATSYFTPDPNEPIQILRVRWDRQTWTENRKGKRVTLDSFESTIHADYLKVIRLSKPRPTRARATSHHGHH